jgi:RNA polymerase sigma factor (sigma-70 family)
MSSHGNNGRRRLAGLAIRCQPDSRLVGLVREGHDLAFEEVVRRYRAPLVAYAGGIVADHHAEDVVQEALTRAHSALLGSDADMNLKPWLFTIVRNGALNALRNEPVHVHLDENYDGVPQPPDVAARHEELAALTANIRNLPGPQQEALVKRELEGRSHAEIGASLGLSAGAVRGLIYRARATLRDAAGMLIPLPLLRALLSSAPASPEAAGAAGTTAAGLAAGGGGVALKAGATLGAAVIAVGSGIAIQHRDSGSAGDPGAAHRAPAHSSRAQDSGGSSALRLADSATPRGAASGREGGASSSGPGDSGGGSGRDGSSGSSGSSSGPGPGSGSGGGSSGTGGGDSGGPGPSGDDGGGGSGTGGGGDDGGGGTLTTGDGGGTSGDGGSGSSGSGSDDGGSSGSGSSGDGGGDTTTTTTTTTTTETTTTTTTDGGGSGTD